MNFHDRLTASSVIIDKIKRFEYKLVMRSVTVLTVNIVRNTEPFQIKF